MDSSLNVFGGKIQMFASKPHGRAALSDCLDCGSQIGSHKRVIGIFNDEIIEWQYVHWTCMAAVMDLPGVEERAQTAAVSLLEMEKQLSA